MATQRIFILFPESSAYVLPDEAMKSVKNFSQCPSSEIIQEDNIKPSKFRSRIQGSEAISFESD
jgi:hypothetical protein